MQGISFSVNKEHLVGNLFRPVALQPKNPAVLFIHGWESQQDRMFLLAEKLASAGYVAMTFDLPGHGVSGGDIKTLSRAEYVEAVVAAYDFLASVGGVDVDRVTAIGSSFGGYLSVMLSSKRKLEGLVLRVPANYPDEGYEESNYESRYVLYDNGPDERQEWKSRLHPYDEVASLRALHDFAGEILIVEAERDELVPHAVVQSYVDAVADKESLTYLVMKDAPHSISKYRHLQEEFAEMVLNWLKG